MKLTEKEIGIEFSKRYCKRLWKCYTKTDEYDLCRKCIKLFDNFINTK